MNTLTSSDECDGGGGGSLGGDRVTPHGTLGERCEAPRRRARTSTLPHANQRDDACTFVR